ncbi:beta-glucosidase 22-like isoform X2 [Asparagus officinalis]|uniref:beta-glucosidase 22-like isoform X2 n=1 Tax=Asparagus officinalis TaxID=4686 RepID=UPI00098E1291|nr:beta-glucosidase 22-like isoform X2 [Asparagus officinalis]
MRFLPPSLLLLLLSTAPLGFTEQTATEEYSRDDFPSEFVFGAGTSAYQYEGAVAEDGRSPSIWDTFTHAGNMADKSTGDVASDGYHKYKEDVKLMSDLGLEAYKFSISWSRILPNGRGAVNPKGLKYYNDLINELIEHGIQPHITLYHLDLPQVLEDEYEGWLSTKIIDDFEEYADACFREFGDRVSHWTTIAEPNVIGQASYDNGLFPPGRCSYPFGVYNCSNGNSTVEPYIAVHNILLAHAKVVNLYRTKYQAMQSGSVGLNVYTIWLSPFSNSSADIQATQRVIDFMVGWVMNPLVFGDYPEIMKKNAGQRLPSFTKEESKQVKGSFDFIGLNHYTSAYVKDSPSDQMSDLRDFTADMFSIITVSKNETPAGQYVPTSINSDPPGLRKMLGYLKHEYGNPPIYIQENGYGLGVKDTLNDTDRVDYLDGFIRSMLQAIGDGSNVRGYFVWSFLDVFEFLSGYESSFGLYDVDFDDIERKRQPKLSAHWYSNFLTKKKKKNDIHIRRSGLQGMYLQQ